jgi:hypothetical protein
MSAGFPRWFNRLSLLLLLFLLAVPLYGISMLYAVASPRTLTVGYMPRQPVPYSHALHVGKLGLDCRYCHIGVEKGARATIPATETCMACHTGVGTKNPMLAPVRESFATGKPVEWVRIHKLPDFAYFDHSAHVTRGVGCVSCHGRVDRMERVQQVAPLTMGWCLDCHRNPEPHLRPGELVTQMDWEPTEEPGQLGARLRKQKNINPSTDCSTCHR